MQLVSLACTHCGAQLPPRAPTGEVRCDYCGNVFRPADTRVAKTQHGMQLSPRQLKKIIAEAQREAKQQAKASRRQKRSRGSDLGKRIRRKVGLIVGFNMILGVGLAVGIPLATGQFSQCTRGVKELVAVTGITQRDGWDTVGGPPIAVTIAGDEALIGRIRAFGDNSNLFIDAYRARDGERIWRIGPLGTYSQAYRHIHFGVLADRVVVSDSRSQVAIHDLQTGALIRQKALTDRVEYLCVPPESADDPPTQVWLSVKDKRHQLLDVGTGDGTEARKKPKWCTPERRSDRRAKQGKAGKRQLKQAPKAKGFRASRLHIAGDLAVVSGIKSPGTAIPRALGFDPTSKEIRWDQAVPGIEPTSVREKSNEWDGLAGGRYVSTYGSGQDTWHLTALDARSGARLWDVTLRSLFSVDRLKGLTVTETHAFLVRMSSVEIFDANTGTLLATIGNETYD